MNERPYVLCEKCGCKLYLETDTDYADERYEIDGHSYCEDCFDDVARDLFKVS
ncbi:MAG: hypothetical protein PHP50_14255 [Lachnospiraceae bacterium]|nr:hypothetical protein [Lachnospiraceae bacterium]